MKARTLLTLLVSLLMAGLAAVIANGWISQRLGASTETTDPTGQVVVAVEDFSVGTKLEATHVKLIAIPEDAIATGSIIRLEDAIGRVATQPLYRGDILSEKRLTLHEGGSPLAVVIQRGQRALTVRVNDVIGVAGFLLPSNHVDIVSTKRGSGNRKTVSQTIVENLKVLAVDQTVSSDKNDPVIVRAVTLEVTPKQAEQIVMATEEGKVQLTLRNPLDVAKRDLKPVMPQSPPAKSKLRSKKRWSEYRVDVIRGTEQSKTLVTNRPL
ncbi:MAG: Flp pilus assembly protein CpaB [Motiliproteus sp.]